MNQFNIIKIYTVFTQQQDTNTIQVPIDYKPGDAGTYQPGDWTWVSCIAGRFFTSWVTLEHIQGQKTRCRNFMVWKCWNRTESVLLSLWNYVRNQYQKIFKNNPHIFKRNVTFTKRHLLWLSHWKNRGWLQRRKNFTEKLIPKWEINIKDTLKISCIRKLNAHF